MRRLIDQGADVLSKSVNEMTPEDVATAMAHPLVSSMLKAEAERRGKCVAFAMGLQVDPQP